MSNDAVVVQSLGSHRFSQLDALRGMSAAMVVFSHYVYLPRLTWIRQTHFELLALGHPSVLLFFVLSGFVLAMQASRKHKLGYIPYLIRRICRIYLPYIAVVVLGAICLALTYSGPVPSEGDWFNEIWQGPLSATDWLNHIALLGAFPGKVTPVIWSLIYEMRASLVFPFLFALLLPRSAIFAILLAIALSCVSFFFIRHDGDVIRLGFTGNYALTLHFLASFCIGASLAITREKWLPWFKSSAVVGLVSVVSLVLFFQGQKLIGALPGNVEQFVLDWLTMIASAGFICVAIASKSIARFLNWGPLSFLGKISYSLYLTHLVVLMTVVHLFNDPAAASYAIAASIVLTLPVAYLTYRYIEMPAHWLGIKLTKRAAEQSIPASHVNAGVGTGARVTGGVITNDK